jgi:hypothetical protein
MATSPSVKVLKTMSFKGGVRTFSNRYHFNGGTPADTTHWHTLMDAIVAAEHPIHSTGITITECIGYAAGSDVPVASKTYSQAGTVSVDGSAELCPGQAAALVRWSTNARTAKNHPIYLFSYMHFIYSGDIGGNRDSLDADQRTAMDTYAGDWITGFSDGTITAVRSSPNGAAATGHDVEEFITHRDFPYTPSV